MQGVLVQSLVGELQSHMPCSQKKKEKHKTEAILQQIQKKILKMVHIPPKKKSEFQIIYICVYIYM